MIENNIYYLPIKTPDGIIKQEILHSVVNKNDDDMSVTLSTTIQRKEYSYQSETTEKALIALAKALPEKWYIQSCISCRYGHFCPVGNSDNELFCVTDFAPKKPCDLWHVTEDEAERKNRSRTLFELCKNYKEQAEEYFTYSDYYYEIMRIKRFDFLRKHFSSYEMKFSEDDSSVEIVNPFYDENVIVEYVPEDDTTTYIVRFAFQHRHMYDKESVIEYINNIINTRIFSIEYFNNGTECFGGDITAEELKDLSYAKLEQKTGYYGITKLKDVADSFKLRGWHSDCNFDAIFVTDENGTVKIEKLD